MKPPVERTSNDYCRVGPSGIHGRGLFAVQDIPGGADIVEYDGPRVERAVGERLAAQGNVYIFSLGRTESINGNVPWNLGRHANHSCAPNAKAVKEDGRVWLRALRDIPAGEEITYDYRYSLKDYRSNPCRCGSPGCIGFIVPARSRGRLRDD